jgi:hypothetical protein
MKRFGVSLALALLCALPGFAQNTQITASHIQTLGGGPVTGRMCLMTVNQYGQSIPITTSTGVVMAGGHPLCFTVTNGVLSNSAIVPDVSTTNPLNACYKVSIFDQTGNQVGSASCIQPEGATWSFDSYVPGSLPAIPALTMPQFQLNGVPLTAQGMLNIICPSCSPTPGGGISFPTPSGASNENVAFSATPVFSVNTTSSRISLSGNITTFTLPAGSDGQQHCLLFVHDGTNTQYSVNPPANVIGFMNLGHVALKRDYQCFTYFLTDALWIANTPGVIDQ